MSQMQIHVCAQNVYKSFSDMTVAVNGFFVYANICEFIVMLRQGDYGWDVYLDDRITVRILLAILWFVI